ncbi:fumarate hydratase [bacterium]
MKQISSKIIYQKVFEAVQKSNLILPKKVTMKLDAAYKTEKGLSKRLLGLILENIKIAKNEKLPLCQDTGMLEVFVYIGEDVKVKSLDDIINNAAADAYKKSYFRRSVVTPLTRKNNNKNIPAVIHTKIVKGDKLTIYVMPKGFGCENMALLKMFNPTTNLNEIIDFIVEHVKFAGPNPCPPIFLGIGIGGTMEKAAFMSKEALLGIENKTDKDEKKLIEKMKKDIIHKCNKLNIGTLGFGGKNTVLDININTFPTHIAGLPVAVSISCWCNRFVKVVI